jgi:hypothetical protein
MELLCIHIGKRMRSIKIFIRKDRGWKRENDGGVNLTKLYFKHICRYHNVFPCTTVKC